MIITKQFIMDNRTRNGAWTKKQIEALGLEYPPKKGWISRVVGMEITNLQADTFSNGKTIFSNGRKDKMLRKVEKAMTLIECGKTHDAYLVLEEIIVDG